MSGHPPRVADYLQHILDAITKATEFAAEVESSADLETTPLVQFALVRALEIIGEAANKIAKADANFIKQHPEIEWVGIRGLRNKVIHDYFEIDYELVWRVVKNDLPTLARQIRAIQL